MGSLTSSPKIPSYQAPAPQIVYVPQPVAPTPSPASVSAPLPSDVSVSDSAEPSIEETQSAAREDNLLRRQRGRFGTITTGFRGILSQTNSAAPARKTLLGE